MIGIPQVRVMEIEALLKAGLRTRLQAYMPESAGMPFHTRLLGKDRLALCSFLRSLFADFGAIFFEPVALELAKGRFRTAQLKATAGDLISEAAQREIQAIMNQLTTAEASPDKTEELRQLRAVCQQGAMRKVKLTKVDILLETHAGELYLFDLKTAKPNIGNFREFKRTLLEWAAAAMAADPAVKVNTLIAIPYNPYEPQPYNRWTMRGMLDLEHELKVAQEFWEFLGGKGAYEELLDCFERVGIELRPEIDAYFARFKTRT
ncbi:MAG: TdeIII family type II restriction endonuclease [candidate division WOR-3 bacterium]